MTCDDINECGADVDNCSSDATCTNTLGSYTCLCNLGFTGNGLSCSAFCPTGYTGNELTGCFDINECEENSFQCPKDSDCFDTIGTYLCQCKEGFIANGDGCHRAECPAGQYTPGGVTCQVCPMNTYSSVVNNSLSECSPCPLLHTTVGPGATSVTQCKSKTFCLK